MIGRALGRRLSELRDVTSWGPYSTTGEIPPPWADGGPMNLAALPVGEARALRAGAVYACTQVIVDDLATLPLKRYRRAGDRRERLDLPALFSEPVKGEIRDYADWAARLLSSLVLRGNCYGRVLAIDERGATQVDPIHPDMIRAFRERETGRLRYRLTNHHGGTEVLDPFSERGGEIWHVRGLTLAGHDEGLSPIAHAQMSVTLALAAEGFGAQLFLDGALPSSVLQFEKGTFPDNPAGRAKARQSVRDFERIHRGRRRTALVQGGEWKPVTLNPNEAQFIETRKFQLEDIARLFRVKPHKIGILDRATFSNIEQQAIEHVGDTLRPWGVRFETGVQRLFPFADPAEYYRVDVAALLRGDMKTRYEAHAIARQWGWQSANGVLALEDEDPIGPAGDVYLTPLNMRDAAQESLGERAKAAELLHRAGFEPESIGRLLGFDALAVADTPPVPAPPPDAGAVADLLDQNTGGTP